MTDDNVIDIKTRKPVLPFQIRGILMAQYAESKANDDHAEKFVDSIELKLASWVATSMMEAVQKTWADMRDNHGRRKNTNK